MNDDQSNYLRRNFSGDIDGADDDGVVWVQRESRGPRLAPYTPEPVRASPETAAKFKALLERKPPSAPSAPSAPVRGHLLVSHANVDRWLDDAHAIESDVKLGQAADHHQVTRLMLEAIPVVEKFRTT